MPAKTTMISSMAFPLIRIVSLMQQISHYLVECFFILLFKLAELLKYLLDLETNYLER